MKQADKPWQRGLRNGLVLGLLVVAGLILINRGEVNAVGLVLLTLPLALVASLILHLPQLVFGAQAWLTLLPSDGRPPFWRMVRLRWYREAGDSLLPAGAVMGQAAVTRLMIRDGVPTELATSTAAIGIALESVAQLPFLVLGLAMLLTLDRQAETSGFLIGLAAVLATVVGLFALQRPPALRALRRLLERLAHRWPWLDPAWIDQFQAAMLRLHANRPALARAVALHFGSWMMGAIEMMVLLWLIGHPVSFAEALVIESFAQVLRNAGFLLPGSAGVQEGAILAAGMLMGVPLAAAANAALVRRTRETLVGSTGLIAWRQDEVRGARPHP